MLAPVIAHRAPVARTHASAQAARAKDRGAHPSCVSLVKAACSREQCLEARLLHKNEIQLRLDDDSDWKRDDPKKSIASRSRCPRSPGDAKPWIRDRLIAAASAPSLLVMILDRQDLCSRRPRRRDAQYVDETATLIVHASNIAFAHRARGT